MTYAIYTNTGTLDMRAVTIMGINAKPTKDSPIGYFGTGLKYTCAVLARLDCRVLIHDGGGNEWVVVKYDDAFRGKDFTMLKLVRMNARSRNSAPREISLPFTTELGKNWEMWMALRELESNMRDEDGQFTMSPQRPAAVINQVRFIIEGASFIECVKTQRKEIFFDLLHAGKKTHVSKEYGFEYVQAPTNTIYYRGIRVKKLDYSRALATAFTYNITEEQRLTEDRTLYDIWDFKYKLSRFFEKEADETWLRAICEDKNLIEWELLDTSYINPTNMPQATKDIIEEYFNNHKIDKHEKLRRLGAEISAKKSIGKEKVLHETEFDMLNAAISKLRMAGYDVEAYEIKVMDLLENDALGMAEDDTIFIAAKNFENGLECLMGTLFEEFVHLKYSYDDHSRELQDFLLRRMMVHIMREQKLERRLARND